MALNWTKYWESTDDGTVLTGTHLQTLQDDISQQCVHLPDVPATDGIIYWTGNAYASTLTLPELVTVSASQLVDIVFSDDEIVSWEDELVYST